MPSFLPRHASDSFLVLKVYVLVYGVCVYLRELCTRPVCMCVLEEAGEGVRAMETGVTGSCELIIWVLGTTWEQQILLNH